MGLAGNAGDVVGDAGRERVRSFNPPLWRQNERPVLLVMLGVFLPVVPEMLVMLLGMLGGKVSGCW